MSTALCYCQYLTRLRQIPRLLVALKCRAQFGAMGPICFKPALMESSGEPRGGSVCTLPRRLPLSGVSVSVQVKLCHNAIPVTYAGHFLSAPILAGFMGIFQMACWS